ncbi:MAG TPA: hypothetical protein VNU19_17870 [Candidatus Acidoferrum sp.]|nr:hypothetical protein [Candidatus Acidoferrum sp.]
MTTLVKISRKEPGKRTPRESSTVTATLWSMELNVIRLTSAVQMDGRPIWVGLVTGFGCSEVSNGEAVGEGVASGDGAMIWVAVGDGTPD